MFHIKYAEDFNRIENIELRNWLKKEIPIISEKGSSCHHPEDTGWLIVIDKCDSIKTLNTGIDVLNNLLQIDPWELVIYNSELKTWLAIVIIGDGFGMAFCIPDSIIMNSPLKKTFEGIT